MKKEIKRGYVKWTDEDGTFHKEPLADHADLLGKASPLEKLRAEEVRRLNAAAEEHYKTEEEDKDKSRKEALVELKKAPDDVLTVAQLEDEKPASAPEEDAEEHEEELNKFRERTSE